jgi:uncharacterized membrane protein YgdD (TMEM256/DUF423 family)
MEVWSTAAKYHLVHSAVLLAVAVYERATGQRATAAFAMLLAGVVVFSGSLYVLVLTGQRWLGALTPLGGLALIAGWILAGLAIARRA